MQFFLCIFAFNRLAIVWSMVLFRIRMYLFWSIYTLVPIRKSFGLVDNSEMALFLTMMASFVICWTVIPSKKPLTPAKWPVHVETWLFFISSPECGQSMSVVRRAASTTALKAYSSYTLLFFASPEPKGQLTPNLLGSIGMTCRSKIAKIVPIGNQRWPPSPPSWKSYFRIFSWTERPIDSKLAKKHQGDL